VDARLATNRADPDDLYGVRVLVLHLAATV